jgi:ribosomal protein S6
MSTEQMPAADAAHYELAFHVLPTVAEGEVAETAAAIQSLIESAGGTITETEAPKRFDLAYGIVKYLEGRNRKFTSAYFGWTRFTLEPSQLADINEQVAAMPKLLRHLTIRLTKAEEEHVFMFHDALDDTDEDAVEVNEESVAPVAVEEPAAAEATKDADTDEKA